MATSNPLSKREQRREREAALRRSDILAAAASAFAEKGFQGAQVAEIANEAELPINAVYAHFKGKEELYEAVIHAAATTVRDHVRAEVEPLEDPGEKLLRVIDALFACFEEHGPLLRLYARTTHGLPWRVRQALGPNTADLFLGFRAWLLKIATEAKDAGRLGSLDPEAVALTLVGAVMTAAAQWAEHPADESLADAAPRIRAVFEALLTTATT